MKPTCEVYISQSPEWCIQGKLILTNHCDYNSRCAEDVLTGAVVVQPISEGVVEGSQTYCCELHAALALLNIAAKDLNGYDVDGKAEVLELVTKSLNGQLMLAAAYTVH